MPRKRLIALAAGVLLVALAVAAIPRIDINGYRGPIERTLTEKLGRDVTIGSMYVSLWPLGLRVDRVAIGEDPAYGTANPFARVGTLYVSPRLLPLLRGQFELRSVELLAPVIELVRNAAGRWNMESFGGNNTDDSTSTLVLNQLRITRGQVAVTDLFRARPTRASEPPPGRVVYRNIDLQVDGFQTGRPFAIALATTLPGTASSSPALPGQAPSGAGAQRVSVQGTVGPLAPDAVATTPFSGAVQFDGTSVSGLAQFAGAAASLDGTDAIATGRLDLNARDGRMRAAGALQLTEVRVRNTVLGYPISADLDVAYDTRTGRMTIERGALSLGTMPVSVSGTVETHAAETGAAGPGAARTSQSRLSSPVLDLRLTAADASISEAARLAAAAGVAFGGETKVEGRLQVDVRARGPANRATFDGQVRLRDLSISGRDIPRPVRTPSLDLTLTPDAVRSNAFVASVDDTSIGARFALGRYTTATPTLDASLSANSADLASVLSIARAFGVQAAEGVQGSGRLTMDVRAAGPSTALQYSGTGSLTNAALATPSLTQPLRIHSAGLTFASDAMSLNDLRVTLGKTTAEGRITVRRFTAPVVAFQLAANTIDVVEMQTVFVPVTAAPQAAQAAAAPSNHDSLLRLATGSGQLRVGTITNGPLVLDDVQATATLDRGVLRLEPLTASMYGGRHRGAIVVDASHTPAAFSVESSIEQVDANRLATATTSLRDVLYGALASNLRVSATTNGVDSIAKSLNGTLSLSLPNGRIAKMDLLQEAANIGRFVTGRQRADRSTPVAALTGNFTVTNGVARTDDLRATLDGGTLGATGTINLVDESVNMRLALVLSRSASQQAGGSRIGGFMTTALANEQGEIVVPIMLSGTMSQPRFAPDVQRFAEMRAKSLVPNLLRPGTLRDRLLGGVAGPNPAERPPEAPPAEGAAPTPPPAPAPKAPVEQLQDTLRGFLRGRARPQPTPQPEPAPAPAQPDAAGK